MGQNQFIYSAITFMYLDLSVLECVMQGVMQKYADI